MNQKQEKGYAIIMVLVLSTVLMLSLTTTISALSAIKSQNRKNKIELKKHETAINLNRNP